ncbi:MAG TPA: hypothetical protein VHA55_10215 [Pseudorhodoplanes sp.]|jgi:hypothetical protein|nr:hypothetical protein [Pseudorhodoplanes sp.]
MRLSAAFLLALLSGPALGQPAETARIVGMIERVDGPTLTIGQRQGGDATVTLSDKVQVFGVMKAGIDDIKPGTFIGVGATPQGDGSQLAIQVTIFAESQRGLGEGHRPWNRPNTTMTNATVESMVTGVSGREVRVTYKGGEQRIIIPPDAIILAYAPGDRSELKPGAHVAINNAAKRPDGSFEAARVNVGRDVVPQ